LFLARKYNPYVNVVSSPFSPPSLFAHETFDYITAFSVFSHLDEHLASTWFDEFARILKPGGLLVFTTMPLSFIEYAASLRAALEPSGDDPVAKTEFAVKTSIAHVFEDVEAARSAYNEGAYLFNGTMAVPPALGSRWGWTLISKKYIQRTWSDTFYLIDYVDDTTRVGQVLVVLQRRPL
jgi:SAM-dependent methyltransferase